MYDKNHLVPLHDMYNRNLSIEWGPKTLRPGYNFTISLAIGMVTDYSLVHPVKPMVIFNKNNFQLY